MVVRTRGGIPTRVVMRADYAGCIREKRSLEDFSGLCSGHGYVVQPLGSQRRASLTVHGRNIISPALSSATHRRAPHDERTKAMNPGSLRQCPRNSSGFEHSLSALAFIARSTSAKRCDSMRQPYSKRGRPVRSRPARRPQMFRSRELAPAAYPKNPGAIKQAPVHGPSTASPYPTPCTNRC